MHAFCLLVSVNADVRDPYDPCTDGRFLRARFSSSRVPLLSLILLWILARE